MKSTATIYDHSGESYDTVIDYDFLEDDDGTLIVTRCHADSEVIELSGDLYEDIQLSIANELGVDPWEVRVNCEVTCNESEEHTNLLQHKPQKI